MNGRNSEIGNVDHEKKPYQRPQCTEMSASEIALLVRREARGREIQFRGAAPSAPAEVSLLLVHGYVGDLKFIRPAVRAPARELEPYAAKVVGWFEMQLAEGERPEPQFNFLMLDLRDCHHADRAFFESIGDSQELNKTIPRVMHAPSADQFLGWMRVDPKRCWHLGNCQTSEELSAALRSFLCLCSMIANWPAEENTALDPGRDHVFSGRSDKE